MKPIFIDIYMNAKNNSSPCSPLFVDVKVKQLDYDSPELSILRKWKYGERWKDTPVDSEFPLLI
jgi:hypothetical protein